MPKDTNVLLVEDNDLDVEILERALEKIGAKGVLHRTRDGLEALQVLKDDCVDKTLPRPFVVLLDVNMPGMNGHEFLQAVRTDEDIRDTRVFMFTTSDSKSDVALAYRNNANGYIVKPNSSADLCGILETLRNFWAICEYPD